MGYKNKFHLIILVIKMIKKKINIIYKEVLVNHLNMNLNDPKKLFLKLPLMRGYPKHYLSNKIKGKQIREEENDLLEIFYFKKGVTRRRNK